MQWKDIDLLLEEFRIISIQSLLIERLETISFIANFGVQRQLPVYIWNLGQQAFWEIRFSRASIDWCLCGDSWEAVFPAQALSFVQRYAGSAMFIVENLQSLMQVSADADAATKSSALRLRSMLVNLLGEWKAKVKANQKESVPYLILLGTEATELPLDLASAIPELWKPLPDLQEIGIHIDSLIQSPLAAGKLRSSNSLVLAATGLSREEITIGLTLGLKHSQATGNDETTVINYLLEYKKERLKRTLDLDFVAQPNVNGFGGLDRLRNMFEQVKNQYTDAARNCGLPLPKGCLLVGPPGTGKSRAVKACAYQLGFPLCILDVGIIVARGVGYLREIIRRLEALAPVVVGFDEFDKLFDTERVSSGEATSNRQILGTLLTWLQEKTSYTYVIATLNRFNSLPPELTREGRFDRRIYVGFPQHIERKEIIQLHAQRFDSRYQHGDGPLTESEWRQLLNLTQNFTPAELEQMVVKAANAVFESQYSAARASLSISIQLSLQDLLAQRGTIFTLFSARTDEVLAMENQAKYICSPASSPDTSMFAPPLVSYWGQRLDRNQNQQQLS
ncbi:MULTISPECIES: AAA family ATPase [Aerosakkonema]|uniref:AAA family ATPase n=1 Tax=Aerosakkonema TaxID=1246629 RepID=UPI0035B7B81B